MKMIDEIVEENALIIKERRIDGFPIFSQGLFVKRCPPGSYEYVADIKIEEPYFAEFLRFKTPEERAYNKLKKEGENKGADYAVVNDAKFVEFQGSKQFTLYADFYKNNRHFKEKY